MGLINSDKTFRKTVLTTLLTLLVGLNANAQLIHSNPNHSDKDSVITHSYKKVNSTYLELTVIPSKIDQQKSPAIVFFFGGGWRSGSIDQFKPHGRYFSQRGVTAILADYRVSSRHGTTPFDATEDAIDAVNYIFQHADELAIDKDKVILSGGSAGGHLALMNAFSLKTERINPAALVLFNPVIDTGPDGYGFDRLGDRYQSISPIHNIPKDSPPIIIFLGTQDHIIGVSEAEKFCNKIERNHGSCELKLYKDQKHGFFNFRNTKYFIETVREADRFLNRHQLIEGEPAVEAWLKTRD